MSYIRWKTGYEIELLAPAGANRRDLAQAYAAKSLGAKVVPVFVPQAEFSRVEGKPIFENLTLGFDAIGADGALIARCVDDLTIEADLAPEAAPKEGWFRVVGDEARLLRLIMRHADPGDPLDQLLEPMAKIFGTALEHFDNGMVRLADSLGAPIAMAAPLPGERERPCEIISPPFNQNHRERLTELIEPAQTLGFTIPQEAALHIHFDAAELSNARAFSNLVLIFHRHRDELKHLLKTNANCVRLGSWPDEFVKIVADPRFLELKWSEVRTQLLALKLNKFVDFNVLNILIANPNKHTFEVRIVPVSFDVDLILHQTALFEGLLRTAANLSADRHWLETAPLRALIEQMEGDAKAIKYWLNELENGIHSPTQIPVSAVG